MDQSRDQRDKRPEQDTIDDEQKQIYGDSSVR